MTYKLKHEYFCDVCNEPADGKRPGFRGVERSDIQSAVRIMKYRKRFVWRRFLLIGSLVGYSEGIQREMHLCEKHRDAVEQALRS